MLCGRCINGWLARRRSPALHNSGCRLCRPGSTRKDGEVAHFQSWTGPIGVGVLTCPVAVTFVTLQSAAWKVVLFKSEARLKVSTRLRSRRNSGSDIDDL